MKGRKQKILETSEACPRKDRTESKGYVGGQTFMRITENNLTDNHQSGHGLLEYILSPSNLNLAYNRVRRNNGAGGVDRMEVESLKDYLVRHKDEDWETRKKFSEYFHVYESIFERCRIIPWHIVPSDKNWQKLYFVAD